MKAIVMLPGVLAAAMATGCGVFTGIPSHGGGKRFAVEQELIAASARAAAKNVDVAALVGKKCHVRVVTIGDEGGGNLVAGRYSLDSFIRGGYVSSPTTRTNNDFATLTRRNTVNGSRDQNFNLVPNLLPLAPPPLNLINPFLAINELNASSSTTREPSFFPSSSRTQTFGSDFGVGSGVQATPTEYQNYPFTNPGDVNFLQAILIESLLLRGVHVVGPDAAEIDVVINVDVFGTHRKRVELHVYNEERLLAKTAFQICAIKRAGGVALLPTTASYEAEYVEHYIAWCGPIKTSRVLRKSEPLLADFTDLTKPADAPPAPVPPAPTPAPVPPAPPAK